jgi:hypothetical protein
VGSYIQQHNFTSSYVFNIDETRSEPRENPSNRYVCANKEGRTQFTPSSDLRTTVNIISADGKCWLSVYIYKNDGTADPDRAGTIPIFSQEVLVCRMGDDYYYYYYYYSK